MTLFHDEEDGPAEPVPGFPEALPEGETVLWQGRPDPTGLAFGAFRLRWIIAYFVITTIWRLAAMSNAGAETSALTSVLMTSSLTCAASIALLWTIAFFMSRAALFSITTERVVLRYGIAIRKYVNAPFATMTSAQLKRRGARIGDIALQLDGGGAPYLHLWPFAKPFKFSRPQPMLRGLREPDVVAGILARAAHDRAPDKVRIDQPSSAPAVEPPHAGVQPAASGAV